MRSIGWVQTSVALMGLAIPGFMIAGCGGGDSAPTSTATATPAAGSYVGKTSQGLPISFVVNSGAVIGTVRFGWRAKCADGQVHTNTIVLPGTRIHYGVFSLGGPLETGGIANVVGRFEGSQASGRLSRSRGSAFGTNCRATGIAWNAHIEPGSGSDGDAV